MSAKNATEKSRWPMSVALQTARKNVAGHLDFIWKTSNGNVFELKRSTNRKYKAELKNAVLLENISPEIRQCGQI